MKNVQNALRKVLVPLNHFVHRIVLLIAQISMMAMVAIVTLTVVLRYCFNTGLSWAEEVPRLLVTLFAFIACAIGVRDHLHVAVNAVYNQLPVGGKARKALDVLTEALTAVNFSASSFDAELRSAVKSSAEPASAIFEALEALTVQVAAFTSALIFEALEASIEHEAASTAALILAALEASIMNLSARSVASLVIFEALDALSERIFPPLAGMVTVMSAFWMLDAFLSSVTSRVLPRVSATTRSIRLSSASMRMSDAPAETTTFTARDASMASKSGAGRVFVTIWPLPLMFLPSSGAATQTT